MSAFFNPREVFEMAVQIERNGKQFYREAADNASDPRIRSELALLSTMEEHHEEIFQDLLQQVGMDAYGAEWYDPEGEAAIYLQSFTEGQVFDLTHPAPPGLIGPDADLNSILHFALEREGDSILFYTGLKALIPSLSDKAKVDIIINEEMGHVALLTRRMSELNI